MFHKEGHTLILITFFITIGASLAALFFIEIPFVQWIVYAICLFFLIIVLQFFRNPTREVVLDPKKIYAPVDGKVVVIEEVFEEEYFKEKRLMVSVFMSPLNVHVTRYALGGEITFSKYHPGKYLVAWNPKSSTENERTTVVVKNGVFGEVLYRQVAGALARRIVNYAKVGQKVSQGKDAGFIKFGSRVDMYLPIGTQLNVKLDQTVKGAKTILAEVAEITE